MLSLGKHREARRNHPPFSVGRLGNKHQTKDVSGACGQETGDGGKLIEIWSESAIIAFPGTKKVDKRYRTTK